MFSRTGVWLRWGVTLAAVTAGIFPWVPVYGEDSGNDYINHIVFRTENRGFGKETTSIVLSLEDTTEF